MPALLIFVRLHDGRYHGRSEWPPSPARLFQALVAGAAQGETLVEENKCALKWLEGLKDAPLIAAPSMRVGQPLKNFVPNNDRDSVESGDFKNHRDYLAAFGKIRTSKYVRPILFDAAIPLLYVWTFDETPEAQANANRIRGIAEGLYQLGRGVDMAWAWGEILKDSETEARLAAHSGALHRPNDGVGRIILAVPLKGSLESLIERHKKMRARFQTLCESKPSKKEPDHRIATGQIFVQPPKPRFRQVAYDSPPARLLFDLVGETWRLDRIVALTEGVRDTAAQRLKDKLPAEANKIHNAIVGRRDAEEADKAARVRITPLPSIGHQHADHVIRRILIEIPPNCPLHADDVEWAFSGLPLFVSDQGEILCELVSAVEWGMLAHYGVEDAVPARLWRTVTPAALPQKAARRRIDPAQRHAEAKGGAERAEEEGKAVSAVIQALRHAGVPARPLVIHVQREPFESKGARAEAFAAGTRFAKERLWHVEIEFAEPQRGPLVIGDGRYLGLGLMQPVRDAWRDVMIFPISPQADIAVAGGPAFLHAVRRALMALARDGSGRVPRLFSGHEADGERAASGRHEHVFLAADDSDGDSHIDRLIIAAPWVCDHATKAGWRMRKMFDEVVSSLESVRAGRLGVILLGRPVSFDDRDPLIGPARVWESRTPYHATRHAGRRKDPVAALIGDVIAECARRRLPRPEVELLKFSALPYGGGLTARMQLSFATAISGPLLLGCQSHKGGGLFACCASSYRE